MQHWFCVSVALVLGWTFVLSISFCTKFELLYFLPHTERKAKPRYCKAAWGTTRENIDSVCLALFTDRQALRNLTALKFITFASARITISLRHYSWEEILRFGFAKFVFWKLYRRNLGRLTTLLHENILFALINCLELAPSAENWEEN
jgi:hypothetical protein